MSGTLARVSSMATGSCPANDDVKLPCQRCGTQYADQHRNIVDRSHCGAWRPPDRSARSALQTVGLVEQFGEPGDLEQSDDRPSGTCDHELRPARPRPLMELHDEPKTA